jgi:lipoate-protein ligase A
VLDPAQPWLRVFEPRDRRLVIGRHQVAERECLVDHARSDGVPIHRRVAGGGAVVLAPGMVVVAARLRPSGTGSTCYFDLMNRALIAGVAACGVSVACRGHGDLTLTEDGDTRKVLGASLRQTSRLVVYLGVFLVQDAVPLMERLLAAPSRMPDYRAGRGHAAFCTHLGRRGVTTPALIAALHDACTTHLAEDALP